MSLHIGRRGRRRAVSAVPSPLRARRDRVLPGRYGYIPHGTPGPPDQLLTVPEPNRILSKLRYTR